ncbi:MAG: hypothetical protein M1495_07215, partial [Bacteroidetes bacterium]|nr:hypothetical protein [Bacteroidota bacterium]
WCAINETLFCLKLWTNIVLNGIRIKLKGDGEKNPATFLSTSSLLSLRHFEMKFYAENKRNISIHTR